MSFQRIAMITGGSQGLGFEIAKLLDRNGLRLILIGRSYQKLEAALKQLSFKEKHTIFCEDLTKEVALKKIIEDIKNRFKDVVNNASYFSYSTYHRLNYIPD